MENIVELLRPTSGWHVIGIIVALGAVTIALLQLIDDLSPIRSLFHWYQLRDWIKERISEYERQRTTAPSSRPPPPEITRIIADDVYALLVWHATGGELVFFGLPIDQLVAQINAAAQIALDNPQPNFSLLAAVSQPTEPTLRYFLPNQNLASRPEGTQFEDLATLLGRMPTSVLSPGPDADAKYLDARNRIWQRIQRNLDGLQIRLNNRSSLFNQILALVISVAIVVWIWLALPQADRPPWYLALLVGVAAGYAAPLIGDIVVAIRRLGRR